LVVVDNAKEFHGANFKDACWQLGIEIDYSPPGRPWFRATVERWFGTLNKSLLHELPGTTFSNIFDKKDYDPQKHALISLERLLEIIHVWIVDVYHQREHKGIRDIPNRRWMEGVAENPPNLPPSAEELHILLGFVEHRTISRSGVELFTLLYNSSELGLIRRKLGEGEKVMVKYDPTDISTIHVWDAYDGRYIHVPALDQDYTRGLTIWQHHTIRRYARRIVKEHVDIVALCRAKKLIQEIVEQERLLKGRIGRMQRIAHHLNITQPSYQEDAAPAPQALLSDPSRQLPPSEINSEASPEVETDRAPENSEARSGTQNGDAACEIEGDAGEDSDAAEEGWGADYNLPGKE
jgi:putative transposase